jgi:DNA-binding MurR/RpiR family transcriptional regulator
MVYFLMQVFMKKLSNNELKSAGSRLLTIRNILVFGCGMASGSFGMHIYYKCQSKKSKGVFSTLAHEFANGVNFVNNNIVPQVTGTVSYVNKKLFG